MADSETLEKFQRLITKLEKRHGVTKDNFEQRHQEVSKNIDLLELQLETYRNEKQDIEGEYQRIAENTDTDSKFVKREQHEKLKEMLKVFEKYLEFLLVGYNMQGTFIEELMETAKTLKKLENKEAIMVEAQKLVQKLTSLHEESMEASHKAFQKALGRVITDNTETMNEISQRLEKQHLLTLRMLSKQNGFDLPKKKEKKKSKPKKEDVEERDDSKKSKGNQKEELQGEPNDSDLEPEEEGDETENMIQEMEEMYAEVTEET